ncbi:DUF3943 domain-containing protein [Marinospirillum perlucidum]|uniref:DUF3943 domain-containing protein n=1 Tax=Marinospirillum perlucidum TaxID=1982602 RepID=UPI000DF44BBA|nr:DUF3943 domain-containing protein [Marinospirillum perlucidum]
MDISLRRQVSAVLAGVLLLVSPWAAASKYQLTSEEVSRIIDQEAYQALLLASTSEQYPLVAESGSQPMNGSKFQRMARETRNMAIMSLGIMAVIYALPEDVSKWDRSEMTPDQLGDRWVEHNEEGPVWDKDEWNLNLIGHPYFGAAYYMVARNQGLTKLESFGYSFLMSTFLWEMGVEAFAETPSRQDILITPIIGSLVGEGFYIWEQRILANDGLVWGSSALGSATLFFLNPAGSVSQAINSALGEDTAFIQEAETRLAVNSGNNALHPGEAREPAWAGIELEFRF